jgi:hypothetical protein
VKSLTQDIGARPAGSAADARAVAWAQARCSALGLQAVRAEPVPLRVWQRGPASVEIVVPHAAEDVPSRNHERPAPTGWRHLGARAEPLVMSALANSVATPAGGIEAPVAWYPSFGALHSDSSRRAHRRIVVVDQRTDRTRDGSGYHRSAMGRFHSASEASRRGALAVVVRSAGTLGGYGAERVAHTGAIRYAAGATPIPALAVSVPDADRIATLQAAGPLHLRLRLDSRNGVPSLSHNVLAEVPGTDLAHEVVLLGAHLDSWDQGEGAADNGAGVAIVCAAAGLIQALAGETGRRPRRTIRVALFANEENGFDGALAYGNAHGRQRHQLVGESDLGSGAVYALRGQVQSEALWAFAAMARVLAPLGVPLAGNGATPGPDAALLMRRHHWAGVELSQDGSAYFDVHHSALDTFARLDTRALPQNVASWAVVAWLAAQAPMPFMST